MAQLVLGVAGAVIGSYFGPVGAQVGFAIGSYIGGAIGPAQKQQGPKLADLKAASVAYGSCIPYIEGHPRLGGVIVWQSDKREIATTESAGKGGPSVETETYAYECDCLYLVAENEIAGIRRIWSNGELVWTAADDADADSILASSDVIHWRGMTVYTGDSAQLPDPTYEAAFGTGNVPAYRGRGSVVFEGLNLGSSGQFPNLTFEVVRAGTVTAYSTAIMHAPLTTDEDDIISPVATASVTSPTGISYSASGALLDSTVPAANCSISYSAASKLSAALGAYAGERISIDCNISISSSGLALADGKRFFQYTSGSQELCFLFRCASGTPTLHTWWYSGGAVEVDHGTAPTAADYKIVFDEDGTTAHFYVDDVLVRSVTTGGRFSGNVVLTAIYNYGYGVEAIECKDLRFYTGTAPYSTDLIDAPGAPLDEVVERQCERAGLSLSYVDASSLSAKSVRAMAVSQITSPRQVIDMLAAAYQFEAVESDTLKFVLRGGAPAITIPYEEMGAAAGPDTPEPLPLVRGNDLEIPVQVTVRFANVDDDYQDGSESSDRLITGGSIVQALELPLGLTPTEAKRIADIAVMDAAASVIRVGPVSLSRLYAAYEPTDVVTLTGHDGSTFRARLTKRTEADGVLAFDGVLDDASAITSVAETSGGYTSSTIVSGAVATVMELLDIPLLRDADDSPGFYVAVKGASDGWPGCTVYGSPDDVTYSAIATVRGQTEIGTCSTTLGNWTGGTVFDEANSLTVDVGDQTLSSWSRDEILAGTATGYVVGSELIYARTATLVSPGVYTLTGLLRGRRGTEWAIPGHAASERFVALPASGTGLLRVTLSTSDIGVSRYYKAVTLNRSASAVAGTAFSCAGVSQLPFAPVDLRADTDPGRDITLTWSRRTRLATRFTGAAGINTPLGEDSEQYEIDILNQPGGSVVRTLSAAAETCDYTQAMQFGDFGLLQANIHVNVYQLSAFVGRGYQLTQSVAVPTTGVGPAPWGTRTVMEMGGYLYAANMTIALSSSDDGQTYTVARDDGTIQVYTYGVNFFDAVLGTQRISIGWNIYANAAGIVVGTTDPAGATTEYRNNQLTEPWYTHGYPRVSGAPIAVGALYSDGTYYYIVGRLADQSQPLGLMYLYRADSSLAFALQGQLEQDIADPNELPPAGFGAFNSSWFTPNFIADSIYNSTSRLQQFSSRWFLSSGSAVYYTDDSAALAAWFRCPIDLGEGDSNPPTALLKPIQIGSTILIGRGLRSTGTCFATSTDNGETWTTSRPIVQYGTIENLVALGSTALLYYRYNGLLYVAAATSPFTSWTASLVDGIAPNAGISDEVATTGGLAAWTTVPAGPGYSDWSLVYSADGITFVPAPITP